MGLTEKLAAAWAARHGFHGDSQTTAYRLFHGHGEGESSLNVDRFGDALVFWVRQPESVDLGTVCSFYEPRLKPKVIVAKEGVRDAGRILAGCRPEGPLTVTEMGLDFAVDLLAAQNAGLFLDARPARQWLRQHSRDRRIANLFAYTGSLGVTAYAGGARSVEQVDLQAGQLNRARLNHELNGQSVEPRDFQAVEVGRWLRQAIKKGRRFDGIILDPPPRTPRGRAHFRRSRLYELTVQGLNPGGWMLVFFNRRGECKEAEEQRVFDSAKGRFECVWRGTSGPDFPEPALENRLSFGAYRKV